MPKSSPIPKQVDSKSNLKIHLRRLNPADVLCLWRQSVYTFKNKAVFLECANCAAYNVGSRLEGLDPQVSSIVVHRF